MVCRDALQVTLATSSSSTEGVDASTSTAATSTVSAINTTSHRLLLGSGIVSVMLEATVWHCAAVFQILHLLDVVLEVLLAC